MKKRIIKLQNPKTAMDTRVKQGLMLKLWRTNLDKL